MGQPDLNRWIKCIATQGNIRGVAIQATDLVQEMATRHKIEGTGARGLGEAVIAGLLISSYCKQGERVNLNIQGSGKFKQALVDAHPDGTVRGYVIERSSDEPEPTGAQGDGPWGSGLMSVLRTRHNEGKQPYIGTVPLLTGHIAKDLTYYWLQSEQIPSAVGIVVETDGSQVTAAGGFLVQALPGATDEEIKAIDQHVHELQSLATSFAQKSSSADVPLSLLSRIFQSTAFVILEEKPLRFQCDCSWDRVRRSLTLVGVAEMESMLDDENQIIVKCDFCSTEYMVDKAMLTGMIADAKKRETDN